MFEKLAVNRLKATPLRTTYQYHVFLFLQHTTTLYEYSPR